MIKTINLYKGNKVMMKVRQLAEGKEASDSLLNPMIFNLSIDEIKRKSKNEERKPQKSERKTCMTLRWYNISTAKIKQVKRLNI